MQKLRPWASPGLPGSKNDQFLDFFILFHHFSYQTEHIFNYFRELLCFYPELTRNEIFYIRIRYTHFLISQIEAGSFFT